MSVPVVLFCGVAEIGVEGLRVQALADRFGIEDSLRMPDRLVRDVAEEVARELAADDARGRWKSGGE